MKNVYNDPAYETVRDSLHIELQKLRDEVGDSEELAQQYIEEDLENPRFLRMMQWMLQMDPSYDLPEELKARIDTMKVNTQ